MSEEAVCNTGSERGKCQLRCSAIVSSAARGPRRSIRNRAARSTVHNERHLMTPDTIELVERVRRRLEGHDRPCEIAGPAPEAAISAAEAALGCRFPPSYRRFLRTFGGIAIPPHLGIVHDFVGVANHQPEASPPAEPADATDVVRR